MKLKAACILSIFYLLCLSLSLSLSVLATTTHQFTLSPAAAVEYTDTSNFIFASFAGLLEQWSNTFAFSGHSIVPGVIPRSTLLYHGTNNGSSPPNDGMEWLAFDPEMSYKIHAGLSGNVHLYTYVSTRPLRVIYLDGQSASLATAAFLDSQSWLISGTVDQDLGKNRWISGDYLRAQELCNIGKTYGFEGVVRMNTGFELIWCDFSKGLKLIQVINATDPFGDVSKAEQPGGPYGLPMSYPNSTFYSRSEWNFARAASRHYKAPGEIRIKLDPSGFVSFYDRVESLAHKRRVDGTDQGPRSRHRLYGISTNDAQRVRDRLVGVLARKNAQGWKVDTSDPSDWRGIVLTIVQTYSKSLENLEYILNRVDLSPVNQAIEVRGVTYELLMPYLDFSQWNVSDPIWARRTVDKCKTAFTKYGKYDTSDLTESIQTIIRAIEGTLDKLCSTLYYIFSQTIIMSLPVSPVVNFNNNMLETQQTSCKILEWRNKTVELIQWLGWSNSWGQCNPRCTPEEICLIPMWPGDLERQDMTNLTEKYPVCQNASYWNHPFMPNYTQIQVDIIKPFK